MSKFEPRCEDINSSDGSFNDAVSKVSREERRKMKAKANEDLDDIPMAYLWYVVFTIMAITATAVILIAGLFWKA